MVDVFSITCKKIIDTDELVLISKEAFTEIGA